MSLKSFTLSSEASSTEPTASGSNRGTKLQIYIFAMGGKIFQYLGSSCLGLGKPSQPGVQLQVQGQSLGRVLSGEPEIYLHRQV